MPDSRRPRLLDLFCGAGGAGKGYHLAGFDVVGVDLAPQPRYPFEFHQGDALEALRILVDGGTWHGYTLADFDSVHGSPPCQFHTDLRVMPNAGHHVDLIPPTRDLFVASGLSYVIENVPGARRSLRSPTTLCGASFALGTATHDLARHRLFECSFDLMAPPCTHRAGRVIGIYGDHARLARRHGAGSQYNAADSLRYGSEAMGIDWMTWPELAQAIPPAYTEHIGQFLLNAVRVLT